MSMTEIFSSASTIPAPASCESCGLLCAAARGWGRCPEAPFEVLTGRLSEFQARFAAVQKRAVKLGAPVPTYRTVGEYTRVVWARTGDGALVTPRRSVGGDRVTLVRVEGERPKLAGWTLLATLSPIALPGGAVANLVKSVPGAGELPEAYRLSGTRCDHCNTSRRRSETFVVRHEDGRTVQVGRQCIADFLGGVSPEHVAALFTFWSEVVSGCSDDEGGWGFGRSDAGEALVEYLAIVVREVRERGWVSRKAARESSIGRASADAAWSRLRPSPGSGETRQTPTEDEIEKARSAVAWACDLAGTSDYEHNVKLVALAGVADSDVLGLAASIWPAYERAMAREVERRQRLASVAGSTYQGVVGESFGPVFVTVTRVIDIEGQFGASHLHLMQDAAGNAYKWFSSSERREAGDFVRLSGAVKKHEDYKGVKSTVLTRCGTTDPYVGRVELSAAMHKLVDVATVAGVERDAVRDWKNEIVKLALGVSGDAAALRQLRGLFAAAGKKGAKAIERLDAALAITLERPEGSCEEAAQ